MRLDFILILMRKTSPRLITFTFKSKINLLCGFPNFVLWCLKNFLKHQKHLKAFWGHHQTSFKTSRDSLGQSGCAGMKIKERVLRDQAALSGLQLGLMAAEHRLSLALIWMSTRRLVLCLPASLCVLPRFTVCQWIALTAWQPPPAMPRSLINILRWLIMIPYSQTRWYGRCRDKL